MIRKTATTSVLVSIVMATGSGDLGKAAPGTVTEDKEARRKGGYLPLWIAHRIAWTHVGSEAL